MTATMRDDLVEGGVIALESFRAELLRDRGRIENETGPVFDVIVDLLDRVTEVLKAMSAERVNDRQDLR